MLCTPSSQVRYSQSPVQAHKRTSYRELTRRTILLPLNFISSKREIDRGYGFFLVACGHDRDHAAVKTRTHEMSFWLSII